MEKDPKSLKNKKKQEPEKFQMPPKKDSCFRFIHISDTHSGHHKLKNQPEADAIIHSGDFCKNLGYYDQVKDFVDWFRSLKYKYKIIVSGNHELTFDLAKEKWANEYISKKCNSDYLGQAKNHAEIKALVTDDPNFIYLEDQLIEIEGIKIWGTPVQNFYFNLGFNYEEEDQVPFIQKIPKNIDVLITHTFS